MARYTLTIPVYDCKVVLILLPDINAAVDRIYKTHGLGERTFTDYACVIRPTSSVHLYYLLYGTDHLNINRFVHEITHLGNWILKDRGHSPSEFDDEPVAYLNGYLAERIYTLLQKQNLTFKTKTNAAVQKKTPDH